MASGQQLLGLLVVVLCTGVASAQGVAPLPASEGEGRHVSCCTFC